ncbi:MAG: S8/S53 family peptidase, partial [Cyanobacteria bacterium]|nr:S8/S53 family peptidase [Cyanobacteriota bacterium]
MLPLRQKPVLTLPVSPKTASSGNGPLFLSQQPFPFLMGEISQINFGQTHFGKNANPSQPSAKGPSPFRKGFLKLMGALLLGVPLLSGCNVKSSSTAPANQGAVVQSQSQSKSQSSGSLQLETSKGKLSGSVANEGQADAATAPFPGVTPTLTNGSTPLNTSPVAPFVEKGRSVLPSFVSESDMIQQLVHKGAGLYYTGRSSVVGVIDNNLDHKLEEPTGEHARMMGLMIQSKKSGVAPDAKVYQYGYVRNRDPYGSIFPKIYNGMLPDGPEDLMIYLGEASAHMPNAIAQRLEEIVGETQNRPTILSMSLSETRLNIAQHLFISLDGNSRYPKLQEALYGGEVGLTHTEKMIRILKFVDTALDWDLSVKGPYAKAISRYQAATNALQKADITLVVAAGNVDYNYVSVKAITPKHRHNVLAMSPSVLVVGASDNRGIVGQRERYTVPGYSEVPGMHILAPGVAVPVTDESGKTLSLSGNSYSTSFVAGVIALMKEAHPALKPIQIKEILLETGVSGKSGDFAPLKRIVPEVAVAKAASEFKLYVNDLTRRTH